jgi:hypothetical protein
VASRTRAGAAVALCAAVLAETAAAGASDPDAAWDFRVASARAYALARAGVESFGVTDEGGRLRGYRVARVSPSASVLKAMLLVAYLRRASVRDRELTSRDRSLLAPMIRWSDNVTAGVVLGLVGPAAVDRLADRAGMRDFRLRSPWGLSEITPRDQARYFRRIDLLVPARHRRYARYLLRSIVPSQRWGIAAVRPPGWALFFKGGWASGTGRVTHQVGLVKQHRRRVTLAILTEWNPSHLYGTLTVRGIDAQRIGDLAYEVGARLYELIPSRGSLEDAFMETTASEVEFQAGGPAQHASKEHLNTSAGKGA